MFNENRLITFIVYAWYYPFAVLPTCELDIQIFLQSNLRTCQYHSSYTSQVFRFTSKLCLIIFMHVAFYCTPKIQHVAVTFNDTDKPLHMERYTANLHYNNLFMAPPSEKREIWGAIIGSPHMYSPQCAPRSLHGEHFDGNLLYYTLTFRQWLHALSLLPWLLMAILKCCLWQSGCK